MADDKEKTQGKPPDETVRRLVREANISEDQARELIAVLGVHNWASLIREARILGKR